MYGKKIDALVCNKHDTASNWNNDLAKNYVPKAGEILIYDPDSTNEFPRFKVGNGIDKIDNLPFVAGTYANNILMSKDSDKTVADAIANAGQVETVAGVGVEENTKNVPLTGADIPISNNSNSEKISTILSDLNNNKGNKAIWVDFGTIDTLPKSKNVAEATLDMVCVYAELGTPYARLGKWTVQITDGNVAIYGMLNQRLDHANGDAKINISTTLRLLLVPANSVVAAD